MIMKVTLHCIELSIYNIQFRTVAPKVGGAPPRSTPEFLTGGVQRGQTKKAWFCTGRVVTGHSGKADNESTLNTSISKTKTRKMTGHSSSSAPPVQRWVKKRPQCAVCLQKICFRTKFSKCHFYGPLLSFLFFFYLIQFFENICIYKRTVLQLKFENHCFR